MPSVKEELRVKRLRGINVRQEVVLNLNIFFLGEKELRILTQNLKLFQ